MSSLPPGGRERILLLDDEASVARACGKYLERLGYRVNIFLSSREALDAIRSDPGQFDLVVTDMAMPENSGLDVARIIADLRRTLPIILVTGHSGDLTPEGARALGISELLMKPFGPQTLAASIRRLLDERSTSP